MLQCYIGEECTLNKGLHKFDHYDKFDQNVTKGYYTAIITLLTRQGESDGAHDRLTGTIFLIRRVGVGVGRQLLIVLRLAMMSAC